MTKQELATRLSEIQTELRDLTARATNIGGNDQRALRTAIDWLSNITQPLNNEETERWEEHGAPICEELADSYDAQEYNEGLNDARRCASFIDDEGMC